MFPSLMSGILNLTKDFLGLDGFLHFSLLLEMKLHGWPWDYL